KMAFEGMAYRKAVEDPYLINKVFSEEVKFIFVGFNALSTSEDKLFMNLRNAGKAEFYWDYDTEYLNEIHEAGTFIRRNIDRFPDSRPLNHSHFNVRKNKVFFIPVYSNTGQASIIPDVLEKLEITDSSVFEKTALVLADEGLLTNTLYGIPANITDINVTMGYPLSDSAIFSLIDSLYELSKNARKNSAGITIWYFSDAISAMNNPLLKRRYGTQAENLRQYALEKHQVYLTTSEILPGIEVDLIFNENLREDTIDYLLEIVTSLLRDITPEKKNRAVDPVQVEMLFSVFTYLSRLHDILEERGVKPFSDTLFRLIRKMLRTMRIPFSGEPLAGLQILGILETRTLDFDNVIILSANEGTLPRSYDRSSFIPYNLRAGFDMPTVEHHDAIYAYYFYRVIQRARNIALIYDASAGGLKTGERSRFLHQLLYDMKMEIEEIQVESTISQIPVKPVIINKSKEIVNLLSSYYKGNGRSLSPSAINEFLNCPVKFYFHYIAGLKQPEDVSEDVDARLFGNLLHNSLRRIYQLFGKEIVTGEKLKNTQSDDSLIYKIIDQAFCEELFDDKDSSGERKPEGYNLIVRQVIFTYIKQFLSTEVKVAPFTIISLEEKHYISVPVRINNYEQKVKVGGVIDRIDLKNGVIRILDYKTGDVKNKFSSIGSLFGEGEKARNDAVFQVLLYCLVYKKLHPELRILPGLFFLRQCHQENFSEFINMDSKRLENFERVEEEFEQRLTGALEELFNEDLPFIQTDNTKICAYCSYAGICRR
ncbi:MAG TPA: PD-(D/E)XK nuclease family protein, partial [Bacteroidales bacterium]|nr:PD-(D/E)XK nuclease family protein [Bacteroidales bacterium]